MRPELPLERDHLKQSAQHSAVIHNPRKDRVEQSRVPLRQKQQEGGRHVLHEGALAAKHRQLGKEAIVLNQVRQLQQRGQLILRLRIEGAIEAAGGGQLSQRVRGLQLVGAAAGFIAGGRGRQAARKAAKQILVRHGILLVNMVRRSCGQRFSDALSRLSYSILRYWQDSNLRPSDYMYSEPGSRTNFQIPTKLWSENGTALYH